MEHEDYILEQLESFLLFDEIPQSIAIFNITNFQVKELHLKLKPIFNKIKDKAKERIQKEFQETEKHYDYLLKQEFKKKQELENKYKSLEQRYGSRPGLKQEIKGWEKDAASPHDKEIGILYKLINKIPKEIQRKVDDYTLVDFNVRRFYKTRKRMRELDETYHIHQKHERRAEYKAEFGHVLPETDEEKEHSRLHQYQIKRFFSKYTLVHNISSTHPKDIPLDELMMDIVSKGKTKSLIMKMEWNVVCFAPNDVWFQQAPEELKEIINAKYKVFNLS